MKFLILPDVHLRLNAIMKLLKELRGEYDKVIFLGDYFDSFHENSLLHGTCTPELMAQWLVSELENKDYTFLFGNHDAHYMIPRYYNGAQICGYTHQKRNIINSYMTPEWWKKLQIFAFVGNYIFSHAGISTANLPALLDESYLPDYLKKEEERAMNDFNHAFWQPGSDRGFYAQVEGGPLWCDWKNVFSFDKYIQVVGHTEVPSPQTNKNTINLDTGSRYYMMLDHRDDGTYEADIRRV